MYLQISRIIYLYLHRLLNIPETAWLFQGKQLLVWSDQATVAVCSFSLFNRHFLRIIWFFSTWIAIIIYCNYFPDLKFFLWASFSSHCLMVHINWWISVTREHYLVVGNTLLIFQVLGTSEVASPFETKTKS